MTSSKLDIFFTKFLGVIFFSFLICISSLVLPFLFIFERFLILDRQTKLWRRVGKFLLLINFKLFRMKVFCTSDLPDPNQKPQLFIANHPTMIDAFFMFSFLGPEIIPLSAPAQMQIFPFNIWYRKMGFVDVARDAYDSIHAPEAYGRHEAVKKLVSSAIKKQKSLLLFPEGHVEVSHEVHYIHTGAARVSIKAKIPIVPLVLSNMDHIFLGGIKLRPGPVYLRVHETISPPKVSRELPYRHAVKLFSQKIAKTLYGMLPHRAIPLDLYDKNPETIGVFVDIDRTIYKYYSQQTFLQYLQRIGKVSRFTTWKILAHLVLEKIGLLSHETLMKRAYSFTVGYSEAELTALAEPFFKEEIIRDFVHNLMVILKDHQKRGHQIFFVSEVIHPLAVHFKNFFKARDLAVTTLEKKNGCYTGQVVELCFGEAKAKHVKELAGKYGIDLQKSYAYGDSPSDIPMISLVRHKVAVRPKPGLKHHALMHGWYILH